MAPRDNKPVWIRRICKVFLQDSKHEYRCRILHVSRFKTFTVENSFSRKRRMFSTYYVLMFNNMCNQLSVRLKLRNSFPWRPVYGRIYEWVTLKVSLIKCAIKPKLVRQNRYEVWQRSLPFTIHSRTQKLLRMCIASKHTIFLYGITKVGHCPPAVSSGPRRGQWTPRIRAQTALRIMVNYINQRGTSVGMAKSSITK